MIKVDYDMIPASVHSGDEISFNNVADWADVNTVGNAVAAKCHTRLFYPNNYPVGVLREARSAVIRFVINGPGNARLKSWYYDTNGQPVFNTNYWETATTAPYGPQNLGASIGTQFNAALQSPDYIQFLPQVKGTGKLHMARLEIDWKV